jgi:hypothetical protein
VGRMIARGYLARERSPDDARANTVKLAPAGREALDAAVPRVEAADARILSMLGPKKREPFVSALRRLALAGGDALAEDGAAPKAKKKKGLKKKHKKARRRLADDEAAALDAGGPEAPDAEAPIEAGA